MSAHADRAAEMLAAAGIEQEPAGYGVPAPAADPGMFYGLLGEIAIASQEGSEADPAGVLGGLLAISGALAGTGPHVRIGNSRHPLLVWPLLIGRTNSGRKGEATSSALRVGHEASADLGSIYVTGLSSGEGLIERIRDVRDPDDDGGTDDKRLLVVEPEMARVMAVSAREGSTLPAIMRSAWEGAPLGTLNRKAISASESHIAVIGNITPAEFRSKVKAADMAGGTWNRYLPLYVARRRLIANPEGYGAEELAYFGGKLRRAVQSARERRGISMAPDANELWVAKIYPEFAEFDEDTPAAEFVQRAAPYSRRIAALYAALDGRWMVSVDDLHAAASLLRYSIASAAYVFDAGRHDPQLDKLSRAVDEAGAAGLTGRQVSAVFGRHLKSDVLRKLSDALVGSGAYAYEEVQTDGRTAQVLYSRKARTMRISEVSPVTSGNAKTFVRSSANDANAAEAPETFVRTMRTSANNSEAVTRANGLSSSSSPSSQFADIEPPRALAPVTRGEQNGPPRAPRQPEMCRQCRHNPATARVEGTPLCTRCEAMHTPTHRAGLAAVNGSAR